MQKDDRDGAAGQPGENDAAIRETAGVPSPLSRPATGRIVSAPIDVGELIDLVSGPDMGAMALFLGTVRASTKGRRVLYLEYEAYAPMAETVILGIESALSRDGGACRVAIVHRVGRLEIGEVSVGIAVASPHRRVALAACAEAIERVKKTAPIWKKEHFEGGAAWVEGEQRLEGETS